MIIILLNKLLVLFFWLSICVIIRNCFFVLESWVKSKTDNPKKLSISKAGLIYLALSIGYVLTTFITGITI